MKNFKFKILNFKTKDAGFTLIEILVTASLIVFTTTLILRNFIASRLNLDRVANILASDIRLAQQLSLSSSQFQGTNDSVPRNRCGYGITNKPNDSSDPNNDRKYQIYAGPSTVDSSGNPVNCNSPQYQQSQDFPFYKSVILDSRIEFENSPRFKDIFFMPPGPTTYIGSNSSPPIPTDPTTYWEQIIIKKKGTPKNGGPSSGACNQGSPNCIYICVYYSGRIEVSKTWGNCPAPY